jgi:hypothetical protein
MLHLRIKPILNPYDIQVASFVIDIASSVRKAAEGGALGGSELPVLLTALRVVLGRCPNRRR